MREVWVVSEHRGDDTILNIALHATQDGAIAAADDFTEKRGGCRSVTAGPEDCALHIAADGTRIYIIPTPVLD